MARRKKIDTSVFASTDALSIDNLSDALGSWEATQPKIERSVWGFQKPLDSFSIAAENRFRQIVQGNAALRHFREDVRQWILMP